MSRDFVHSDFKKIKNIASMYNLSENLVQSIIESYFGLCLYNMVLYQNDKNIFGDMTLDSNFDIKLVSQSPEFKKISRGELTAEDLLRMINNGREVI